MKTDAGTVLTSVSHEQIAEFRDNFWASPENRLRMNSVVKNGVNDVALNRDAYVKSQFTFSTEIETGPVSNQKQSGRCWLFAGLNTIRAEIARRNNMKPFELSQSYQMFWDKFEKANYFMERIFDTLDEATDSRIVSWLLQAPLQDGGQWDMFVNLVEKYGVVPQIVMPESFHSSKSAQMNRLLTQKLRKYASDVRSAYHQGVPTSTLRTEKEAALREFYQLLCVFLGEPPTEFTYEYRDKDGVFHRAANLTPLTFFKQYAQMDLTDYVSIINAPTADKPYHKTYTVQYLGNVEGGRDVHYLNVDMDTFKQLTLAQLQSGEPVWFGCDVGQRSDRDAGIMDTALFDYDQTLGASFDMDKGERLDYGESLMTHAMVFTGVNVVDGVSDRWKVENSWGKEPGRDGFFVMSDAWFEQFMYQVVVHRKHLSEQLQTEVNQAPVVLKPWDPMGSLALMR